MYRGVIVEMFILTIGLIVIVLICSYGHSKKCPNCLKWFSSTVKGKKELGRKQIFKTVIRQDQHRSNIGLKQGTTERQEQIRATIITYENFLECKRCQHQWTAIYSVDIEGWY